MRYWPFHIGLRDEGVATVARLMGPRIFGQAAFQTNIVAMRAIASFLSVGRISAFNYAYVLMMLPHGIFAMSLATVTFPTMAAQFAENDLEGLRRTLSRATRVLIFLTIPSAVGLFLLRQEIVATLFQFGAFNRTSTELVSSTLAYFALGLVAYAVVEILTRAFYALHDTATPVGVAVVAVLLNLGVSLLLTRGLGWTQEGLALSLALTTTLEMVLLWALLGRKLPGWGLRSDSMFASTAKSVAAAAAMALVLWLVMPLLHTLIGSSDPGKVQSIVLAVAGIVVGGLTYLLAATLLRSEEVRDALGLVLRRLGRARNS
jgi:putative peptidoglycan lipid II flippase